jgi:hypothetical protein
MMSIKFLIIWIPIFNNTQSAVLRINKEDKTHQLVFKQKGDYATDVHFHHIQISVDLNKIINTATRAMTQMEIYFRNLYQQSLMYYKDHQRGNLADKHQAHIAAQLIRDTSDFITNTSSAQLTSIKNNLLSITSMLPMTNIR